MEGTANPLSATSESLPPPTAGGYYPAPQRFENYNPHALYYGNITAIQEQPTATTITYHAVGDHYLTMSIALTILSVLCGMYSLICTLPALIFSMKSQDAYRRGDVNTALSYGRIALRFNIAAMVTWIMAFIILASLFVYDMYLLSL